MNEQQAEELRIAVRSAYSAIAEAPDAEHPIPVGRELAVSIGYPSSLLDSLPERAVEAFAGVGNVSVVAEIRVGDVVLDLGCGAGLDSLITARRVAASGRVIGVDFSTAMVARAHQAAQAADAPSLSLCLAESRRLPLRTGSIDVALVNGIFNLNPDREAIFEELARVVRPEGSVYAAELILRGDLPDAERQDEQNWFA